MNLAALLLTMIMTAEPAAVDSQLELKVMSFNLRYGLANDGENAWQHRRDLLIETITEQEPDILGTQECQEMQAEYLAEKLPGYRWFGMPRSSRVMDEMTAIFYKKGVLDPVETGTFWLSETPDIPGSISWDSSLPRIATWAKFLHRKTGRILFYFNTHFDHRGEQARQESAKLLLARISALPAGVPAILTGDFNTFEASPAWTTLTQGGLQDAWRTAAEKAGPEGTFHGFRGIEAAGEGRIDWIMLWGPIEVLRAECITKNQDGRYPSDHFPVATRIRISG